MSSTYVTQAVRQAVMERDRFCCAYCQTQAIVIGADLEIEHIIPRATGGESVLGNLCLSCSRCNRCKGKRTTGRDPVSGEVSLLFNPRTDTWDAHFIWDVNATKLIGLSKVGRATVQALRINAPIVVIARQKWVAAGWHPPKHFELT